MQLPPESCNTRARLSDPLIAMRLVADDLQRQLERRQDIHQGETRIELARLIVLIEDLIRKRSEFVITAAAQAPATSTGVTQPSE